ncbi:Ppx/GppA phosphatase family protein [Janibacter alkaliphilus]|uniref:Exopolyphosphatase/guanosine-5'-triphosphate, 3'-diphosphate pyrophosphatase n=1 Tax=Janibacter alkaliphilus TaxID=1069963 RepID=A0A852XBF9_9MICO|nr:Ppx/GppA phosphatase family protein [Janibacter alkaliphilus]NYG35851.1 exopolyphosphatase/guanosine-5'-triphosphate,3'-diphosphate pyrophosphatase [Janibacter alkaliphilus]
MRVGAVDCGTNSIRLLVADVETDAETGVPTLTEVLRRTEVVRLGQGVDRTGYLDQAALARTIDMAAQYAQLCREHEVAPGAVRFVATSASRDAENADEFVTGIRRAFGELEVSPEVVSGDEEARLSFAGATGGLLAAGFEGSYAVVDLGGGSTEVVRGTHEVVGATSLDIGCVRMTERHLRSDPPTQEEVDAARWDIATALDEAEASVGFGGVGTLVGLAGSVTTVTAHALGLTEYDRSAIHLARLSAEQMMTSSAELLAMTRDERAALGFMHPGRVDVIGAGALVWHEVIARVVAATGPEVTVTASEQDILDGIALSIEAASHAGAPEDG